MDDPSYGGWGGRMVQSSENPRRWEDGEQVTDFNPFTNKQDDAFPQTRWIDVLQNDFAARADWCVNDFKSANHAPVVTLNKNNISAKKGESISLTASVTDPDDDKVSFKWWQYDDADSYHGKVNLKIAPQHPTEAIFTIPADAKTGDQIHVTLEVADEGVPSLTRYQRAIITVTQ
jgi:hypothetical protein